MKYAIAVAVLLSASAAHAQSMVCRPLPPHQNSYIDKNETVAVSPDGSTQACHIETEAPKAKAAQVDTDTRPRVFLTDSQSWSESGDRHGTSGGSHPQNAELVKTFQERCPGVVITNKPDRANFTVTFEKEGGKGLAHKSDKIAVFNQDGDAIYSASTHSLGNAVKDACSAIESAPKR